MTKQEVIAAVGSELGPRLFRDIVEFDQGLHRSGRQHGGDQQQRRETKNSIHADRAIHEDCEAGCNAGRWRKRVGVEPTQDCKQPLPGLKSGRPTGSDSLPLFQINQDVNCVPRRLLLAEHFGGGGAGLLAVGLRIDEHAAATGTYHAGGEHAGKRGLQRGVRDRKSTRLNSSHIPLSRMPSSA